MRAYSWKVFLLLVLIAAVVVEARKKEDCLEQKCVDKAQRQKPMCQDFCRNNPTRCKSEEPGKEGVPDCAKFKSKEDCIKQSCNDVTNGMEYHSCMMHCEANWKNC